MGISTPSNNDERGIELAPEVIAQVVDILAETYPLGHEKTPFIAGPYLNLGGSTNLGIELIVEAVKSKTGLGFLEISRNEHTIIPAYLKKIDYKQ
jgi:hypothetical protein